jgi:hypothetical protein
VTHAIRAAIDGASAYPPCPASNAMRRAVAVHIDVVDGS